MTNTSLALKADKRSETGKKVDSLRQQGQIPAVLYGNDIEPVSITLKYTDFEKVYKEAGESTLIDLSVDGAAPVKVLIQDYQLDPRINQFLHVDLHQVNMKEKIHTEIPLKFVGEAPAVKTYGGILVTQLDSVQVACLPQDLVHEIEVDISGLTEIDSSIHVSDVKAPQGLEIHNAGEDLVAIIQAARTAKEVEDAQGAAPESATPEGAEEGDKPAEEAPAAEDKKE